MFFNSEPNDVAGFNGIPPVFVRFIRQPFCVSSRLNNVRFPLKRIAQSHLYLVVNNTKRGKMERNGSACHTMTTRSQQKKHDEMIQPVAKRTRSKYNIPN